MNKYFELLQERKIDQAYEYRKSLIPNKLVKFVSLTSDEQLNEQKFETLAKQQLWFSSISNLNDPYEFQCMYINHEKLKKYNYDEKILAEFDNLFAQQLKNWAVTSLSANSFDCLPMWAYYK